MVVSPNKEYPTSKAFIRMFEPNVNESELVWHRDKKDRKVSVVKGKGWKFQMDNELPIDLKIGDVFEIKKNVFHRLHQGKDRLILHIKEYDAR